MAETHTVRMRLLRDSDVPPQPDGSDFLFGLQDGDNRIFPGARGAGGMFRFDFELVVKEGPSGQPVFTGPFASGPRDERFIYLSWLRSNGQGYINRIKARLKDIDWPLVRAAQASGKPLVADMSGRKAGGGTTPVDWRVAED